MAAIREFFVDILNQRIPLKDLTVYEPGCGDGVFTERLVEFAKYVYASDAREEQCAAVRVRMAEVFGEEYVTGGHFGIEVVDSEVFFPPGGAVDVLFHVGLLYHLNDPVNHLTKLIEPVRKAVFLDTHYTKSDLPETRHEDVKLLREGIRPRSQWLPLPMIIQILEKGGFKVEVIDDRTERNGPRVTLLATRRENA